MSLIPHDTQHILDLKRLQQLQVHFWPLNLIFTRFTLKISLCDKGLSKVFCISPNIIFYDEWDTVNYMASQFLERRWHSMYFSMNKFMNWMNVCFMPGSLPLCYRRYRQLRYEDLSGLPFRKYSLDGNRRHIPIHTFINGKSLLKDYHVPIDSNIIKKFSKNILNKQLLINRSTVGDRYKRDDVSLK